MFDPVSIFSLTFRWWFFLYFSYLASSPLFLCLQQQKLEQKSSFLRLRRLFFHCCYCLLTTMLLIFILFRLLLAYWIFNQHPEIQHSHKLLRGTVFFCDWLIQFASENERDISLLGSFLHFHSSYYKIFVLSQKIIRKNLYRKEARKIREWNQ